MGGHEAARGTGRSKRPVQRGRKLRGKSGRLNEPKLLIADEPTTALDATIQAQILDLLAREQRRRHMAIVLITHDLGVLAGRTDEIAVMYAGRIVERAPTRQLFRSPRMPYTHALLAAIPRLDAPPHTLLAIVPGRPSDPARRIPGCAFAPRCPAAADRCRHEAPPLAGGDPEHRYACWFPLPGAERAAHKVSDGTAEQQTIADLAMR